MARVEAKRPYPEVIDAFDNTPLWEKSDEWWADIALELIAYGAWQEATEAFEKATSVSFSNKKVYARMAESCRTHQVRQT